MLFFFFAFFFFISFVGTLFFDFIAADIDTNDEVPPCGVTFFDFTLTTGAFSFLGLISDEEGPLVVVAVGGGGGGDGTVNRPDDSFCSN